MTRDEFLVEDYKIAVGYLSTQYERLWQRFNFFLTVHTALIGVAGWLYLEKNDFTHMRLVAVPALVLAALWYAVGAQDRYLTETYRARVQLAAKRIAAIEAFQVPAFGEEYVGAAVKRDWRAISSWYMPIIGVTHMPVWVAGLVVAAWVACLSLTP